MTPLVLVWLAACGGGDTAPPARTPAAVTAPPPAVPASRRVASHGALEMRTSGLTGSLSSGEVREALLPRAEAFGRCFLEHGGRLRTLGGRMELAFHVDVRGRVTSVHGVDSTIGHRKVERCILGVAAATRFPAPHGGEADFSWPLELDPPEHVRHPVTWDPGRVASVVRRRGPGVLRRCGTDPEASTFQVTTYVARNGRVLAAGAVATEPVDEAPLDCVARLVRAWRMPRHRDHQAKVTFELR